MANPLFTTKYLSSDLLKNNVVRSIIAILAVSGILVIGGFVPGMLTSIGYTATLGLPAMLMASVAIAGISAAAVYGVFKGVSAFSLLLSKSMKPKSTLKREDITSGQQADQKEKLQNLLSAKNKSNTSSNVSFAEQNLTGKQKIFSQDGVAPTSCPSQSVQSDQKDQKTVETPEPSPTKPRSCCCKG